MFVGIPHQEETVAMRFFCGRLVVRSEKDFPVLADQQCCVTRYEKPEPPPTDHSIDLSVLTKRCELARLSVLATQTGQRHLIQGSL